MPRQYFYGWAGLVLRSPIEIVELRPSLRRSEQPDLVVQLAVGSIDLGLLSGPPTSHRLQAMTDGGLVLRAPGWAEFAVHPSGRIEVFTRPGAPEMAIKAFIIGPILAAVAYLRGWICLHASAVAVEDRAMLFCGDSGAGKSTLAAHLACRGHRVLCDDTSIIATGWRRSRVLAADRSVKLRPDTLARMREIRSDLESERISGPSSPRAKFHLGPACTEARPELHAVYGLVQDPGGSPCKLERLSGARALELIVSNSHRKRMLGILGIQVEHLGRCLALLDQIEVYQLRIPQGFAHMDAVISQLESAWADAPRKGSSCRAQKTQSTVRPPP